MTYGYCSKCENLAVPGQRYCRKCHAEYMRHWRPKYKDLSPIERRKNITRSKSNVHQKMGRIKKQPCVNCGSEHAEKHHRNYADAYDIVWLCMRCHRELHDLYETLNIKIPTPKE